MYQPTGQLRRHGGELLVASIYEPLPLSTHKKFPAGHASWPWAAEGLSRRLWSSRGSSFMSRRNRANAPRPQVEEDVVTKIM